MARSATKMSSTTTTTRSKGFPFYSITNPFNHLFGPSLPNPWSRVIHGRLFRRVRFLLRSALFPFSSLCLPSCIALQACLVVVLAILPGAQNSFPLPSSLHHHDPAFSTCFVSSRPFLFFAFRLLVSCILSFCVSSSCLLGGSAQTIAGPVSPRTSHTLLLEVKGVGESRPFSVTLLERQTFLLTCTTFPEKRQRCLLGWWWGLSLSTGRDVLISSSKGRPTHFPSFCLESFSNSFSLPLLLVVG